MGLCSHRVLRPHGAREAPLNHPESGARVDTGSMDETGIPAGARVSARGSCTPPGAGFTLIRSLPPFHRTSYGAN